MRLTVLRSRCTMIARSTGFSVVILSADNGALDGHSQVALALVLRAKAE